MKFSFLFCFYLFLTVFTFTQSFAQEFQVYDNGLMYSKKTIGQLHQIADSLNLQFKKCEVRTQWKSFDQAIGFSNSHEGSIFIERLVEAFKKGVARTELPVSQSNDTTLIIRYRSIDDETGQVYTTLAELGSNNIIDFDICLPQDSIQSAAATDGGTWYWGYTYDSKKEQNLYYYYVIDTFKSYAIRNPYSGWINYSQCMVDTTTEVFLPNAKRIGGFREGDECDKKINIYQEEFEARIDSISFPEKKPPYPDYYYRGKNKDSIALHNKIHAAYENEKQQWYDAETRYVQKRLSKQSDFKDIAEKAWNEAKTRDCFTLSFADNLGRYYNKSKALDLKRARIKTGFCSVDNSPRQYLAELAILSAEAGRWDVFLRAHLDLMNDRVRRNSDNSLMYKRRGIYINELEALPLDLTQLFPGMIFRIDNAPNHHYYNTLTRSSRCMALSKDSLFYCKEMLSIAADTTLDPYNRILFAHVTANIGYSLGQPVSMVQEIRKALSDLPDFLINRFEEEED